MSLYKLLFNGDVIEDFKEVSLENGWDGLSFVIRNLSPPGNIMFGEF